MKKVIFRESDYCETSFLYDDDGIKEISGKNNALYVIVPDRYSRYCPVNKKEFEALEKKAENIADDFNALMGNDHYYFVNFKECMRYYGIDYNPTTAGRLKKWAKANEYDATSIDALTDFLTITTGEKWDNIGMTGYCQGDYAIGIYCEGHHTKETLDLYVGAAAGTVSEFYRIEGDDVCSGFFVTDSTKWNTDELRKELASYEGDDPDKITIEFFNGYTQIASYKAI